MIIIYLVNKTLSGSQCYFGIWMIVLLVAAGRNYGIFDRRVLYSYRGGSFPAGREQGRGNFYK